MPIASFAPSQLFSRNNTLATAIKLLLLSLPAAFSQAQEEGQALNPVGRALAEKGAETCAPRAHELTNYMGFGTGAGVNLLLPNKDPDKRIAPVAMEVLTEETGSVYVSATFAPDGSGGCGATYDAVSYWPQSCDSLKAGRFDNTEDEGVIKERIRVLNSGPVSRIFLMPAGEGCVAIKKEMVY